MTLPWLLVMVTIGWTLVGMLVAVAFGRFIRGPAPVPIVTSTEGSLVELDR